MSTRFLFVFLIGCVFCFWNASRKAGADGGLQKASNLVTVLLPPAWRGGSCQYRPSSGLRFISTLEAVGWSVTLQRLLALQDTYALPLRRPTLSSDSLLVLLLELVCRTNVVSSANRGGVRFLFYYGTKPLHAAFLQHPELRSDLDTMYRCVGFAA